MPNETTTVDSLLDALGQAFDLSTCTATGSLGDAVEQRLLGLDVNSPPIWGTEGSISQVAQHETEALDFYYRPHLFPEMSPELRLAHHLQFDLLPRQLPSSSPFEIAAVLESYCHLSGDLIGWRHDDDGFLLWIADVAGHGVRAGLAAAVVHFLVSGIDEGLDLAEFVARLNRRMLVARNPDDRRALYATAFFMRLSSNGRYSWTSAGHPPVFWRQGNGSVSHLRAKSLPIGLIPEQSYHEDEIRPETGDTFLLYTDGLLEARSPDDEEFGLPRIEALVASAADRPIDLSRAVYRRVKDYRSTTLLDDDLTFLAASLA